MKKTLKHQILIHTRRGVSKSTNGSCNNGRGDVVIGRGNDMNDTQMTTKMTLKHQIVTQKGELPSAPMVAAPMAEVMWS